MVSVYAIALKYLWMFQTDMLTFSTQLINWLMGSVFHCKKNNSLTQLISPLQRIYPQLKKKNTKLTQVVSWNDFISRPGYMKRTSYGFHNWYNMPWENSLWQFSVSKQDTVEWFYISDSYKVYIASKRTRRSKSNLENFTVGTFQWRSTKGKLESSLKLTQ